VPADADALPLRPLRNTGTQFICLPGTRPGKDLQNPVTWTDLDYCALRALLLDRFTPCCLQHLIDKFEEQIWRNHAGF
jgi:hypothetical protein